MMLRIHKGNSSRGTSRDTRWKIGGEPGVLVIGNSVFALVVLCITNETRRRPRWTRERARNQSQSGKGAECIDRATTFRGRDRQRVTNGEEQRGQ